MRTSGILLPLSALPGEFSIGTMGADAYDFIDFLSESGQHYWQILPLGHTGFGDSPYQCFSAFAGNPYFIDPGLLNKDGLLDKNEIPLEENTGRIDYGKLFDTRIGLITSAADRVDRNSFDYLNFERENQYWLDDYALFMSIKENDDMKPLKKWEDEIRQPDIETIENLRDIYKERIRIWKSVQFLFYRQWNALKKYANARGVEIIGDVPIYISAYSVEMWRHSELFVTDEDGNPSLFSGCPPDRYAPLGQLWGNPIYDWNTHAKSDFSWWISRLHHSAQLFDVIRIDHFRGFEDYYAVNSSASNAVIGEWYKGPSTAFVDAVKKALPNIRIIAEDLGNITDDVKRLLEYSGYPGMKILQFAFDDGSDNEFLPHNYIRSSIAYTGTHDNPTMKQWAAIADDSALSFAKKYLGVNNADSFVNDCIRTLFSSVCDTVIIPMHDWLSLGAEARINIPSIANGNWTWRMKKQDLNSELKKRIADMTSLYFRSGGFI